VAAGLRGDSGGSVGGHVFPALAYLRLNWNHIEVFWVDERAVPRDDAESNYAMAESLWLQPAAVPRIRVHRMPADESSLTGAAVAYGAELDRVLGRAGRFDFVLLGAGADGHVASLFPGHAALADAHRSVIAVDNAPTQPVRRLTLSLPVLASASRVVVAVFGEAKAQALAEAVTLKDSALPVAQVLRRAERPLLVLDHAAASRIPVVPGDGSVPQ
jgi:6-phosphogluconolactonase